MSIILIRLGVSGRTGALARTSLWIGMISRCDSLVPNTSHISFLEPVLLIISTQGYLSNLCFPALLLRYSGKKKKHNSMGLCSSDRAGAPCSEAARKVTAVSFLINYLRSAEEAKGWQLHVILESSLKNQTG